jgi:hypothetical protein
MDRRTFLKSIGITGTVAALPGCVTVPRIENPLGLIELPAGIDFGDLVGSSGSMRSNATEAERIFAAAESPSGTLKSELLTKAQRHVAEAAPSMWTAGKSMANRPPRPQTLVDMAEAVLPAVRSIVEYQVHITKAHARQRAPKQELMPSVSRNGVITLPPGSRIRYTQRGLCLDPSKSSPRKGDKFQLSTTSTLYGKEFAPLVEALSTYSRNHPAQRRNVQQIIWTIAGLKRDNGALYRTLQQRHFTLIEKAYPGGGSLIKRHGDAVNARRRLNGSTQAPVKTGNALADQLLSLAAPKLNGEIDRVNRQIRQATRRVNQATEPVRDVIDIANSITMNGRTFDLSALAHSSQRDGNRMIDDMLNELARQPIAKPIPDDNSHYTLLAPSVAARVVGTDVLSAQIEVVNASDTPYEFRPERYYMTTTRNTQPMMLAPPRASEIERVAGTWDGFIDDLREDADVRAMVEELAQDLFRTTIDLLGLKHMPDWLRRRHLNGVFDSLKGVKWWSRFLKTIPLVGNVMAGYEVITGRDVLFDKELSTAERVLSGLSMVPGMNSLLAVSGIAVDMTRKVAPHAAIAISRATHALGSNAAVKAADRLLELTTMPREFLDVVSGNDEFVAAAELGGSHLKAYLDAQDAAYRRIYAETEHNIHSLMLRYSN